MKLSMQKDKTLLIGVGAQKTGTSWLGKYFEQHPDVFMSPLKELHHFDCRYGGISRYDQTVIERLGDLAIKLSKKGSGDQELAARYDCALWRTRMIACPELYPEYFARYMGDAKVACEITPSYSLLDSSIFARMRDTHSKVRFIFLMRNPVDRYWSQLRFRQKRARRALRNFDAHAEVRTSLANSRIVCRGDYTSSIENLLAAVPKEFIFFEFYEQLFQADTIDRLCRFLEIESFGANFEERINWTHAEHLDDNDRAAIFSKFEQVYYYVKNFMGDLPPNWQKDLDRYRGSQSNNHW